MPPPPIFAFYFLNLKRMLSSQTPAESAMEPILTPNDKRFVLFPIQYPEVSSWVADKLNFGGLANVQESRSFFLDS